MNRQLLSLITAAMVLIAAFASCKKDKDGSGNSGGASVINATVVDGDDYNDEIATVTAWMYNYDHFNHDHFVVSGKYENGGFKLNLPKTVSETYLYSFDEIYGFDDDEFEGTISDPKVKINNMWIKAYNSQEEGIGVFNWKNEDGNEACYVYADRNVTIKGRYGWYGNDHPDEYWIDEFDCSFTKGWNIMYTFYTSNDYKWLCITKKPSDVNYKWYYDDYSDGQKSPTDRQHPLSKMRQCVSQK